jgi:hypothetical protein
MTRFAVFVFAITSLFALLQSPAANAQASRTWVSGVGDDANPCSRTAPCKTFAGAISKTAVNGEINCLDPGGFGSVTITKSITIDCTGTFGSILNAGTNGINIPFDSFSTGDPRQSVRLRGIAFNGFDSGIIGIRIIGASSAGSEVTIENCLIDGNFSSTARGISDERAGGKLFVLNTIVRNMGGTGIAVAPASGNILATLESVKVFNAAVGVAVTAGGVVQVSRSVLFGNGNGIQTLASSFLSINDTQITQNGNGINNTGTVRVSNSDISFNSTAVMGAIGTYGNNRIFGNGGGAPTLSPAGGTAEALGQQ